MGKAIHLALTGKLVINETGDGTAEFLISDFNLLDELALLDGKEVHLEAIAYEDSPGKPSEPVDADIIQRLMGLGDDGSND